VKRIAGIVVYIVAVFGTLCVMVALIVFLASIGQHP
jgi:hypothetical protein